MLKDQDHSNHEVDSESEIIGNTFKDKEDEAVPKTTINQLVSNIENQDTESAMNIYEDKVKAIEHRNISRANQPKIEESKHEEDKESGVEHRVENESIYDLNDYRFHTPRLKMQQDETDSMYEESNMEKGRKRAEWNDTRNEIEAQIEQMKQNEREAFSQEIPKFSKMQPHSQVAPSSTFSNNGIGH